MLILNSDEIENQLHAKLEGISDDEREEWLRSPITEGMGILFECIRMKALEGIEAGVSDDMVHKLSAQAAILRDLRVNLSATIRNAAKNEVEDDENSSSGA